MSNSMRGFWVVARREFVERVRTWWFVAITLLGPIGMAAILIVPIWLQVEAHKDGVDVAIINRDSSPRGQRLVDTVMTVAGQRPEYANLKFTKMAAETSDDSLTAAIRDKKITGYLEVLPVAKGDTNPQPLHYSGTNTANNFVMAQLRKLMARAARQNHLDKLDADAAVVQLIFDPITWQTTPNTGIAKAESSTGAFILGYAAMIVLYMAILLYAVNVLRSVIQEKSNRVVEIVVSAARPNAIMLGKVIGVGSVGLLQLGIWVGAALLLIQFHTQILGLFGVHGAAIPAVTGLTPASVTVVLLFFLGGYFLYASLYAAIGAAVNSEQEAQQAQIPVTLLLVIPVVCAQLIANDPTGDTASLFTLIPFFSPVLMPMRYLMGGCTLGEVALSFGLLVVTLIVCVWLSARIYRVGILMYGKKPTFRELVRWVRHT